MFAKTVIDISGKAIHMPVGFGLHFAWLFCLIREWIPIASFLISYINRYEVPPNMLFLTAGHLRNITSYLILFVFYEII